MTQSIYLDHSASTPIDPHVLDVMMPYFSEHYGNSSSLHRIGKKSETAIEDAREIVASILHCKPNEIIFTGGGSESDNLAIQGVAWAQRPSGRDHLVTTPVEHSAVINTVKQLTETMGFHFDVAPVDEYGRVNFDGYSTLLTSQTSICSVIYANNEVGTILPISKLAGIAHQKDILFHTDAVQAAGQLSLNTQVLNVDLMSISAHKFYGPKGVGALYCRGGIDLVSHISGGSHEAGRRAGTHNTPGIVGLATALKLAYDENKQRVQHYQQLRDYLINAILDRIPGSELTGHPEQRLPSHASFVFEGVDSSQLLMHLDIKGIAASGGSACKTGNPEPSSVLLAMGYPPELAIGSLRLSVGRNTTQDHVGITVDTLVRVIPKLRKLKVSFLS